MPTIRTASAKGAKLTPTEADSNMKRTPVEKTADYTLNATHNREFHYLTTAVATVTLPDISAITIEPGDWEITLYNTQSTAVTVSRNSQNINGSAADLTLYQDESVTICADATPDGFYTKSRIQTLSAVGTADSAATQTESAFTSIPPWATQIVISIYAFSTNGTVAPMIQLGDSGGYETSGYVGSVVTIQPIGTNAAVLSSGFSIAHAWAAASVAQGSYTLTLANSGSNTWTIEGGVGYSNVGGISTTRGYKSLTGSLDRLRIYMDGTDQFDGSTVVNIQYRR